MKEQTTLNPNARYDQMVWETQQYLNATYGNNPHWEMIEENGKTGWPTIRGLIRALQIETGISTPNGNFGPATEAACPTLKKDFNPSEKTKRLNYILQGSMWCKGFSPGGLTGTFGDKTEAGIKQFQEAAGLSGSNVNGIATPLIIKALLNMDAFRLVSSGDAKIRQIQQELNRDYYKWIGLKPTDGRYGRDTNKALIYALQVEGGIETPNGTLGPSTQASLPTLAPGSKNAVYVRIMQYCLYCNRYDPTGFTGVFGNNTLTALKKFQDFCLLVPDGYCGKQTWMSLLVSHGDKDRKGEAFDCSTPITQARANTLKANGYKYAGRYISGGEKKRITIPEIELILANGMKWFPIFQKSGNSLSYFNAKQGLDDANECLANGIKYRIPSGSTIYFAVDFDAMDGDVTTNILPYFKAIKNRFDFHNPRNYKIGIYGARNVCSRVSDAGYAVTSFVCDMSSGFSGNLGYPLPKNWAFDQIKEYTIGSGDGAIAIDNNLFSGRDKCIDNMNNLTVPEVLNNLFKAFGFETTVDKLNWEQKVYTENEKIVFQAGNKVSAGSGPMVISLNVKECKIETSIIDNILSELSWVPVAIEMKKYLDKIANSIGEGSIAIGYTYDEVDGIGLKIEVSIEVSKIPEFADIADIAGTLFAGVTIFPKDFNEDLKEFVDIVKQVSSTLASAALGVLAIFLLIDAAKLLAGTEVVVSIIDFITALIKIIGLAPASTELDVDVIEVTENDTKQ